MHEISQHILDVLENSVEAGASTIDLSVVEDPQADLLLIEVTDNGKGMTRETAERVLDPFFTTRTTRHVGLGLPLLREAARRCGGDLTIRSAPGQGTSIRADFSLSHIDRAPLGDLASTLLAVLLSGRPVDLRYTHRMGDREFGFDSAEVRRWLDGVPFGHTEVRRWLRETLEEGEASLRREDHET
jgi:hypothetical protein